MPFPPEQINYMPDDGDLPGSPMGGASFVANRELDPQQSEGLAELVQGLVDLAMANNLPVFPFEILDALWIASIAPKESFQLEPTKKEIGQSINTTVERHVSPSTRVQTGESRRDQTHDARRNGMRHRERRDVVPVFPIEPGSDVQAGQSIRLPAPHAMNRRRELLLAFHQLFHRGPSRIRKNLDLDRTIRRLVDERFLEIFERAALERQLDLLLVLDYGSSMDVWRKVLEDLAETFCGSGAFRKVTVACLVHREGKSQVIRRQDVFQNSLKTATCYPAADKAPGLVLIVSDCVSRSWQSKEWFETLDRWGRRGAVALLQVLPEELWESTALEFTERRVVACPGWISPNAKWSFLKEPLDDEHADVKWLYGAKCFLPVASLFETSSIQSVSEFLAGRAGLSRVCFRLRAFPNPQTVSQVEPNAALEAFRVRGSPIARRLARLLAASPAIALPLARILQENFMDGDGGGPRALAEVWLSGLLEPLGQATSSDPEQVLYDFRKGIRQTLLDGVPKNLRQRIIEQSSEYIERHLGRLPGLRAMIADPESHQNSLKVGRESDPIAWILKEILERQGHHVSQVIETTDEQEPMDLGQVATHIAYHDDQPSQRFAWSPRGDQLAIPRIDGNLSVRDFAPPQDRTITVSRHGLNQATWSPDGLHLAVACFTRVVRIYNRDLRLVLQLEGHNSDVMAVAYSPDGKWLATGTSGGTLRVWDTQTWSQVYQYAKSPASMIRGLCWIDARCGVVANSDSIFFSNGEASWPAAEPKLKISSLTTIQDIQTDWLTEKLIFVVGTYDGRVQFIKGTRPDYATIAGDKPPDSGMAETSVLAELFLHGASVTGLSISDDKTLLASNSNDGSVVVVSLSSGKIVARLRTEGTTSPYSHVAFRPGTHTLAAAENNDRQIRLFDLDALHPKPPPLRVRIVGSTRDGQDLEPFATACAALGRELARRGHTLVCSSGKTTTADYHAAIGYIDSNTLNTRIIFCRPNDGRAARYYRALQARINEQDLMQMASRVLNESIPSSFREGLRSQVELFVVAEAVRRVPGNRLLVALYEGKEAKCTVELEEVEEVGWTALAQAQVMAPHADALVSIGGSSGTSTAFEIAREFGIPAARMELRNARGIITSGDSQMPDPGSVIDALELAVRDPHRKTRSLVVEVRIDSRGDVGSIRKQGLIVNPLTVISPHFSSIDSQVPVSGTRVKVFVDGSEVTGQVVGQPLEFTISDLLFIKIRLENQVRGPNWEFDPRDESHIDVPVRIDSLRSRPSPLRGIIFGQDQVGRLTLWAEQPLVGEDLGALVIRQGENAPAILGIVGPLDGREFRYPSFGVYPFPNHAIQAWLDAETIGPTTPSPANLIWFVEARPSPDGSKSQFGSAVKVRLKSLHDGGLVKSYLLTCAHVVREIESDYRNSLGPWIQQLFVWPPFSGFDSTSGRVARIINVLNLPADRDVRQFAAEDWVLLDVQDPDFATSPAVETWSDESQGRLSIWGYPGGTDGFINGIVSPVDVQDFRMQDSRDGVLTLTGPGETRPGMGGGGLFDKDGRLVGLHRSSYNSTLLFHSIAASHIRARLMASGYEAVVGEVQHRKPSPNPRCWIRVAGSGIPPFSEEELLAARAVGKVLAESNCGLITGGWPGVDEVVAEEFWIQLQEQEVRSSEEWILHMMRRGKIPSFTKGRIRPLIQERDAIPETAFAADALITIGGNGGTGQIGHVALSAGLPVFPLGGQDTDSGRLREMIMERFPQYQADVGTLEEFEHATRWPLSNLDGLRQLLLRVQTKPAEHLPLSPEMQIPPNTTVSDTDWKSSEFVVTRGHHPLQPTPVFRLGLFPVRNFEYFEFVKAGGYQDSSLWGAAHSLRTKFRCQDDKTLGPATWESGAIPQNKELHPVTGVCFYEALAFATWLNQQRSPDSLGSATWQIPTEDIWEYAARIAGRPAPTFYPWGNDFGESRCNSVIERRGDTSPAGAYPTGNNPLGCSDLAGNVWEFVLSPESTYAAVLRGGSFWNNEHEVQSSLRLWGVPRDHRPNDFGFRCALVMEPVATS